MHGNPTSSCLWRNIIPHVAPHARCIALGLIGFGHSDKPAIAYRIEDHARYVQGFIEALSLDDIVFVLHDWGSALGLDWSHRHPDRVRGLALMEFIPPMPTWLDMSAHVRPMFSSFRGEIGRNLIIEGNAFVEKMLPGGVIRKLSHEEMEQYRRPLLKPESRAPHIPLSKRTADRRFSGRGLRDGNGLSRVASRNRNTEAFLPRRSGGVHSAQSCRFFSAHI
jgi:haloalkane dehalogenase